MKFKIVFSDNLTDPKVQWQLYTSVRGYTGYVWQWCSSHRWKVLAMLSAYLMKWKFNIRGEKVSYFEL